MELFQLRLALLYKIVTGHMAVNPDQIGLVTADNRSRANNRYTFKAIGASSSGLRYSIAVRTVSDWNQLPAVVERVWVVSKPRTGEPVKRTVRELGR